MTIDNEIFTDIVRYEHETISETTITNSNIGSPIFWSCNLKHLVFDTCDFTNARFFAGCTIDHCTFIRSDLRSVGIARNEAVFTNCEFPSCDLRGMTLENATFIDCTFLNADLMTGFYKRRISSIVPLPASWWILRLKEMAHKS